MPLESVSNTFDDATHHRLDRKVEEAIEDDLDGVFELKSNLECALLLIAIVRSSKAMDKKYLDLKEAKSLIKTQEELRTMLNSAWSRKSYREIRSLAILRAPESTALALTGPDKNLLHNLSKSFGEKFCGAAVEGFYEYLTRNEILFKKDDDPMYYAKFCSIIQSSGTGKSRILTELGKKGVMVIYMNLRQKSDKSGFPLRDEVPSTILTEFPPTEDAYQAICYAFLTALFDTLQEYLSRFLLFENAKDGAMCWVGQMCDVSDPQPRSRAREEFFRKVFGRYEKVRIDHACPDGVDEATKTMKGLALSDSLPVRLSTAYNKMAVSLENVIATGNEPDRPKLVIALDEAHTLTPVRTPPVSTQLGYRPADVFCRVVNEYSRQRNRAVWVVFASTVSNVAGFSPPNQKHDFDRVAKLGEKIFPPYTQLGWDQRAYGLGETDIKDISRLDHIVGYGRPLWQSLRTALEVPQIFWNTVSSKLCGGSSFDPSKPSHVLAVLGQRFGLNVMFGHPDSVEHLENGVASNLCIYLAATLDRNRRVTDYPSEPLLSCVAATQLHAKPEKLQVALKTLLNAVHSGMVDKGQRGELASRLLWLLAKDLFVRAQVKDLEAKPSTWDEHLLDCQMVPVLNWLDAIFGPRIWDKEDPQTSVARQMFKDAYLNFSHWICMEANIAGSKEGNELGLYEWTRRHWQRTSAVQCCHQQPRVDKVIPIYFKGKPDGASVESRMSHIFILDKARESKDAKGALHDIAQLHESISGRGAHSTSELESDPLPYIAILADLGQRSSFSVTFPTRDTKDRCLRIYAAGVDTSMYPFLAAYPALMKTLKDLVHLEQMPDTLTPYAVYLDRQMRFGLSSLPDKMLWEHGKMIPDVGGDSTC